MNTPSQELACGLTGPEFIVVGAIAVAAYAVGKRIFRTLSGDKG